MLTVNNNDNSILCIKIEQISDFVYDISKNGRNKKKLTKSKIYLKIYGIANTLIGMTNLVKGNDKFQLNYLVETRKDKAKTLTIHIHSKSHVLLGEACVSLSEIIPNIVKTINIIPLGKLTMLIYYSQQPSANDEDSVSREVAIKSTGVVPIRRNAVKKKIYDRKDHLFEKTYLRQPTYCSKCNQFIWGVFNKQGFKCKRCKVVIHKRCLENVDIPCKKAELSEEGNPHSFQIHNYSSPTFCNHCGTLLYGVIKQGMRCRDCRIDVHKRCQFNVPNSCTGSPHLDTRIITASSISGPMDFTTFQKQGLNASEATLTNDTEGIDYELIVQLGRGTFGKVILVIHKENKQIYAAKILKKAEIEREDLSDTVLLEKSILILGKQSPFIARLYHCFETHSRIWFIMDYLSGGDLMFHVSRLHHFTIEISRFISAEILLAIKFLHQHFIIHRDIKLDNVLLDHEGHVKLVDFGLAKQMPQTNHKTSTFCGTPDYMAPEIILGMPYSYSVDFWAFGILLYEMMFGMSPFTGDDQKLLYYSILNEEPYIPRKSSIDVASFLNSLLIKVPEKRLGSCTINGWDEILNHSFYTTLSWESIENKSMPSPFIPKTKSKIDFSNFDSEFTYQKPHLTPQTSIYHSDYNELMFGFSYRSDNQNNK